MIRKVLLIVLLLAGVSFGQATNWNIDGRPNGDWFSGNSKDTALSWMRAIDPLVAASGNPGTGSIFYVDSGLSSAGDGSNWANAVATLDEAVNLCTAGQGDVIYLAQGHTETLGILAGTDAVDIDVDDVTVIQVGSNTISNGFDYSTGTTGSVNGAFVISGDDVTLVNLRFHANVLDCNEAVELEANASSVSFIDCLFDVELPGTDEFFRCIKQDGANANMLTISGCEFRMGAGAAECAIDLIDSDYAKIIGNKFTGDYSIADVNNATTASISITIAGNEMTNGTVGGGAGLNAQPCIELKSDTSGVITDNYLVCNVATPNLAIVGADMWVMNNWYTEYEGGVSAMPMWSVVGELTGDADIDISEAVYTGYINMLTITAPATGLLSCRVDIDFNKSTTGWDNIATAADVLDVVAVVQTDGTNYRSTQLASAQITANGNGTLDASESGVSLILGPMQAGASVQIHVKMDTERDDSEQPYRVTYVGAAPTITAVAIP